MAKFKVGDRVKTRMPNGGWSDPVVIERIIEREGKKFYVCRTNNGTYPAHEWDIRFANSRAAKNDADPYLSEKLKLMIRQGAVSEAAGGKPMPGDVVFEYRGKRYYTDKDSAHMVKQFSDAGLVKMHNSCGVRSTIPVVNAALNGGDDAIIRLCNPGNLVEASRAGSLHEVRYGAGFVYPLIGKDGVLVRVFRSLSEAHRSPLLNAALGAARNGAASVCNDKWIDDFHVIVSAGKPDASLVEALKKKAKAWKIARRNFSDSEAGAAHDKAEEDAKAIAKRLGARWVQQGAVLKVVMPNAAANALPKVGDRVRRAYGGGKEIGKVESVDVDRGIWSVRFPSGVAHTGPHLLEVVKARY